MDAEEPKNNRTKDVSSKDGELDTKTKAEADELSDRDSKKKKKEKRSRDDDERDKDRDRKKKDKDRDRDHSSERKRRDRKEKSKHRSHRHSSDSDSDSDDWRKRRHRSVSNDRSRNKSDKDKKDDLTERKDVAIDKKDDADKKDGSKDKDNDISEKRREKRRSTNRSSSRRRSSRSPDRSRRDKDRDRDRDRRDSRDRRSRRSESRDRYRDRDRERDRDRDRRDRERDRERERERERDRERERERDRERERERERERDRERERERNKEKEREEPKRESVIKSTDTTGQLSLKDIIKMYPGISIVEAAQKLNAHNAAVAAGANATSVNLNDAATKPHRELYVGNLPPGVTSVQLVDFITTLMKQLNLQTSPQGSVVNAWISTDAHYAFVEFRTIEETLSAITHLNGLQVAGHNLKIGRPKGYSGSGLDPSIGLGLGIGLGTGSLAASLPIGIATASTAVSNVIMVTNLPLNITESQAKELLATFGQISAFNIIKSPGSQSQSAVVEYSDSGLTDIAVTSIGKLDIAGFKLSAQRVPASTAALLLQPAATPPKAATPEPAPRPSAQSASAPKPIKAAVPVDPSDPLNNLQPTLILRLSNMTTPEDLSDSELFAELKEDVTDECNKYGEVVSVLIPRGAANGDDSELDAAVGYIFVEFTTTEGATKARSAVNGRTFNGNTVAAQYFPEALFYSKKLVVPGGYFDSTPMDEID